MDECRLLAGRAKFTTQFVLMLTLTKTLTLTFIHSFIRTIVKTLTLTLTLILTLNCYNAFPMPASKLHSSPFRFISATFQLCSIFVPVHF